jgi:hypothetical protein
VNHKQACLARRGCGAGCVGGPPRRGGKEFSSVLAEWFLPYARVTSLSAPSRVGDNQVTCGDSAALRVRRRASSSRVISPLRRLPFLLAQKKGSKNCAFLALRTPESSGQEPVAAFAARQDVCLRQTQSAHASPLQTGSRPRLSNVFRASEALSSNAGRLIWVLRSRRSFHKRNKKPRKGKYDVARKYYRASRSTV